jgi:hypothetical protein
MSRSAKGRGRPGPRPVGKAAARSRRRGGNGSESEVPVPPSETVTVRALGRRTPTLRLRDGVMSRLRPASGPVANRVSPAGLGFCHCSA